MSVDFVKLFSERTVWKISPGRGGKWWDPYFRKNNSIGLGDPPPYNTLEDLRFYESKHEFPKGMDPNRRSFYWQFANDMKKGDIVIATSGGKILGICEVIGDYRYYDADLPHRRKVRWIAICKISNKFGRICKAVYKKRLTLFRINKKEKAHELHACGERLNELLETSAEIISDFPGHTVADVLNAEAKSSTDLDFLKDLSEDILRSKNPETVEYVVRRLRRDRRAVDPLKALYAGRCQFIGCTHRIETKTGWYTEVHHLISPGEGGSDHPTNLVNLCPQHHKILHHAKNRKELAKPHNLWYHSKHKTLFH